MELSFSQRFGILTTVIPENTFPEKAIIGLTYLLEKFVLKNTIENNNNEQDGWYCLYKELLRVSKKEFRKIEASEVDSVMFFNSLKELEWYRIYEFCERVYGKILTERHYYDYENDQKVVDLDLKEVRQEYEDELNTILSEENIPYVFVDGVFTRPGRPQTQKAVAKAFSILSRSELKKVKEHYNKAYSFYSSVENPDYANSIKESICSLELAAEIMSGSKVSKDFSKEMTKLAGNVEGKIPTPLVGSMIKIFGYRGTADGVTHGISDGLRASKVEAELILSITASFITYLVEFFDQLNTDIQF